MSLEKTLSADIVTAMKAKDQTRLTALRMLKTALMNKNIEKGRDLETAEELAVLSMLVKQRRDSIDQYTKGGRKDLADKEQAEILILETYQPAAASDDEIAAAVAAAVDDILLGRWARPDDGPPLWDGHAGPRIAAIIDACLHGAETRT